MRLFQHSDDRHFRWLLIWFAALASALLSWLMLLQNPVVNPDAVEYLVAAKQLVAGDWRAASETYRWLFYPWLIAQASGLTGGDFELAARLLDTLFLALAAIVWLQILIRLGYNRRMQVLGVVILVMLPAIADFRGQIVRDHGYILFYLLGLGAILAWARGQASAMWLALFAFAVAGLFRVEGWLFAWLSLLLPLLLHPHKRMRVTAYLLLLLSLLVMLTLAGWWLSPQRDSLMALINDPWQATIDGWRELLANAERRISTLRRRVLPPNVESAAPWVYVTSVMVIVITVVIDATDGAMLLMALWAWRSYAHRYFDSAQLRALWLVVTMHVVTLSLFAALSWFLTERYVVALWLTLLLPLPVLADALYQRAHRGYDRRVRTVSIILLVILFGNLLHAQRWNVDHLYMRDAGQWMAQQVEADETVYTGNRQVLYYADIGRDRARIYEPYGAFMFGIDNRRWLGNDWIVMEVKKAIYTPEKLAHSMAVLGMEPVARFPSKKGKAEILIFDNRELARTRRTAPAEPAAAAASEPATESAASSDQ